LCVLAPVVAAVAAPSVARAQPTDPAAADALFRKGREAAEKGDWATACPKFAESQRLDPAPGTLLNLADCEEHTGALASAYEHFKTALETMAPSDDRVPFAKQHIAALDRRVPHLTLNAAPGLPGDAKVTRDDVTLGSASFGLALPMDPGTHTVVVSAPGHQRKSFTVTLKAGDAQALTLSVGDVEAKPLPAPLPRSATPEVSPSRTDAKRPIGIALGVIGIGGLVAGVATGALVLSKKSVVQDPAHCDQTTHACDQAGVDAANDGKTFSTVSTVAFAAGGAALVAGVVLFITGGSSSSSSSATVVTPTAYAGGAGLRVMTTF
jgi:hypothetical protein